MKEFVGETYVPMHAMSLERSKAKRDLLLRAGKQMIVDNFNGAERASSLARTCCKKAASLDSGIEVKDRNSTTVSKLNDRLTTMILNEQAHETCKRLIEGRMGTKSLAEAESIHRLSDKMEDRSDIFDEVTTRIEELSSNNTRTSDSDYSREDKYMRMIQEQAECDRINTLPSVPL